MKDNIKSKLNIMIKRLRFVKLSKKARHNAIVWHFKQEASDSLKVKRWSKNCHANIKIKKAEVTMLISDRKNRLRQG